MLTTILRDLRTTPPTDVDAEVVIDFPDSRFPDVEAAWSAERLALAGTVQHAHWDWIRKLGNPDYRYVAVTLGASVEGLMAVARQPRASSLAVGEQLLYVAVVEVAPWNLHEHPSGARFRGVGRALVASACRLSYDAGFDGRIALSSLPQADGFYRTCGMTECGTNYGLVYFELDEATAAALRTQVGV